MRDVLLETGVSIEGPEYLTLFWALQWKRVLHVFVLCLFTRHEDARGWSGDKL
jgi:hypothetical protein